MEHLDYPHDFERFFDENEVTLLWGWDRRLLGYFRHLDLLPLVSALRKRLHGRAITCLARTNPQQAELYESAARGWKLVADRLAVKYSEAA